MREGSGRFRPICAIRGLFFAVSLCFAAILFLSVSLFPHSSAQAQSGPTDDAPLAAHTATLNPFLYLVPTEDGSTMLVSAGTDGELANVLYANVGVGGSSSKEGWSSSKEGWTATLSMIYSDTAQAYLTTVTGFTPTQSQEGRISITTTTGLATADVEFTRAFVPSDSPQSIHSSDGNMEIQIVTADTLPADAYVAITPSYAPPGPAPAGKKLIGSVYSIRAAGALARSDKRFLLRLYYNDDLLGSDALETLDIYGWDGAAGAWRGLDGNVFTDRRYVSAATDQFTTYGLMGEEAVEWRAPDWFVEWWNSLLR